VATARWGALAVLVAAVVVAAACGAPKYHYVKSSADRTYVRVPHDWTLFDEEQLVSRLDESPEAKEQYKRLTWSVAFDAAPRPSLDNVMSLSVSDYPVGIVQVRTLLPEQRDQFSLSALRSVLLDFDPLASDHQADVEVLESRDVERPGGLHGNELLINIKNPEGGVLKWRQIALVDSGVRKVHVLAIRCDADCYARNQKVIDQVVSSWKVKES
jgi:hypothetical protein